MASVAIDGPAGAGKSTIAKLVAKKLGAVYVDTGAMYRAIAVYFLRNHLDPENPEQVAQACQKLEVAISYENGAQQVWLNGENVTGELRTEAVGNMASKSSAKQPVRDKLLQLQRDMAVRHYDFHIRFSLHCFRIQSTTSLIVRRNGYGNHNGENSRILFRCKTGRGYCLNRLE